MGFESVFAVPQLTQAQWSKVMSHFEAKGQFVVLERSAGEHPTITYSFDAVHKKTWPEDFVVAMQPPGVYLLFHSATSQQEVQVTALLTECLQQVGITGAFEEL